MEDKNSKLNIPYYQVAKAALMNPDWNGLSEEEAIKRIESSTFEEIEGQVWAKGSMDYAIESIAKRFSLLDKEKECLESEIYYGEYGSILTEMGLILEKKEIDPNVFIMDTLFAVHDGWVKDNEKKFFAREKKHQHMPSELIGWKEAKADLLFIRPIFEAAGIEVNEEQLEKEYNRRVKEFFLDNKIYAPSDLMRLLAQGEKFYPAWEGQEDIIEALKNEDFVASTVIPQIDDNGIGKTYEVKDKILLEIVENPKREDLERLTKTERVMVNSKMDEKIKIVTAKLEVEKNKNILVDEILAKADKLNDLNKEIQMEKDKRKRLEDGPDFKE